MAASIWTKIQYIKNIKETIKKSIKAKKQPITDATPFDDYSTIIDNIPKGTLGEINIDCKYSFYNVPMTETNLKLIPYIKPSTTSSAYMFRGASNFTIHEIFDTSNIVNFSYMYYGSTLETFPNINTSNGTNFSYMFEDCTKLKGDLYINIANATSYSYLLFYNLVPTNLEGIVDINPSSKLSSGSENLGCFYNLKKIPTLKKLTFLHGIDWTGGEINISGCSFTKSTLLLLFNSLPTIIISKKITITNNPGTSELTEEEIAIATDKGWSITN